MMRIKKIIFGISLLVVSGFLLNVFGRSIESINLLPSLDISRFAPYTLQVNTSGDILSGELELSVTDSSGSTCWNYYASGTCESKTLVFPLLASGANTRVKTGIYPDYIYPEIFFAPSKITWDNPPQDTFIRTTNYHIMDFANPFTMVGDMSFWIEVNAIPIVGTTSPILVYIVGSGSDTIGLDYFEEDWRYKDNTQFVGSFSASEGFHHTHTANSSHRLITLSTNADGTIGSKGIDISNNFKIVLFIAVRQTWNLRYHDQTVCDNQDGWYTASTYRIRGQLNDTWTTPVAQSGCPDAHIHIARRSGITDYVQTDIELSYNSGGTIETITASKLFSFGALPNIAPNQTSFNSPISGSYKGDILIERNTGTDANKEDTLTYNISLVDSDGNFITELITDTTGTSYILTGYEDDYYNLTGTVCDASDCTSFELGEMFVVDNTSPIVTGASSVLNTTSQTPDYSFTASEEGTITYSGGCTGTTTTGVAGNNTITFSILSNGTYTSCQLQVTDTAGNNSVRLHIPSFTVNYSPPSGGRSSIQSDSCPTGDYSPSYYDGICGSPIKEETNGSAGEEYSNEIQDAYEFAYQNGITTMDTIEKANLEGTLIRSHLAKMMSNFAINILKKTPDTNKVCNFSDREDQSQEMKTYTQLACQLGLMGLEGDGTTPMKNFDPEGIVTRAQFGTVMSRLLRGTEYAGGEPYYTDHLNALKMAEIMNKIEDPSMEELRGWTMLMMMRANQKITQ